MFIDWNYYESNINITIVFAQSLNEIYKIKSQRANNGNMNGTTTQKTKDH